MTYGAKKWCVNFDPYPTGNYYLRLFDMINFELECHFDCWGLPSKTFLKKFKDTFKKPLITITPKSGSNKIRKENKGCYYSNRKLLKIADYANKIDLDVEYFFSIGLPYENKRNILETFELIKTLGKDRCYCNQLQYEPASMWYTNRDKYGVTSQMNNFLGYYYNHKFFDKPSYETSELSKSDIKKWNQL